MLGSAGGGGLWLGPAPVPSPSSPPFAPPRCVCCCRIRSAASSRASRLTCDSDSSSCARSMVIFSSRSYGAWVSTSLLQHSKSCILTCSSFRDKTLIIRSSSASYALMRSSSRLLFELAVDSRRADVDDVVKS